MNYAELDYHMSLIDGIDCDSGILCGRILIVYVHFLLNQILPVIS